MTLSESHRRAVLEVSVLAAFADGGKSEDERRRVREVSERLRVEAAELPGVVQDVLLGAVTPESAAGALIRGASPDAEGSGSGGGGGSPVGRAGSAAWLAYEMAVVVCEADGRIGPSERAFLDRLRSALRLDADRGEEVIHRAEDLMDTGLDGPPSAGADPTPASALPPASLEPKAWASPAGTLPAGGEVAASASSDAAAASVSAGPAGSAVDGEVDGMVLRYAVLNAALEMLPQNLATLAILPLQTKMVYRIGRRYGHSLDRRSIGEFIATLGIGGASQALESVARKFLGGWMKRAGLGGLGRTAATTATGAAFGFASTYAIGQLAKSYYAGGRRLSVADLKSRFGGLVDQGKGLYERYRPQAEERSRTLSPTEVLSLVRGA